MTAVLKLIEKQQALWDIHHRLEDKDKRPGRCLEGGVSYGPCLLISRECGSGGGEVARLTGQRLGWQVYDREIVDKISQLAHARQCLVQSVDEKVRTQWESTWRPMLDREDVGCEAYLRYLREVVMALGHHGDVIILGRGAQYMLPSCCCLRVRLIGPVEQRARRISELKKMPLPEAEVYVRRLDEDRGNFIRKNFHRSSDAAQDYDLVINTAEISLPTAAEIVLSSLRQKLGVCVTNSASSTL